jgi:hypothetical protein
MSIDKYSSNPSFIGRETVFGCPKCNGILYEVAGAEPVQFRCQQGHTITLDEMCPGVADSLRGMLASAVGALMRRS